jgi:hypothetical protein
MLGYFVEFLLAACLAILVVSCSPKPPDTSTFPSPYTYPTAGQPPEIEEPR